MKREDISPLACCAGSMHMIVTPVIVSNVSIEFETKEERNSWQIAYPCEAQVSACDEAVEGHVNIDAHVEADTIPIARPLLLWSIDVVSMQCCLLVDNSGPSHQASIILC